MCCFVPILKILNSSFVKMTPQEIVTTSEATTPSSELGSEEAGDWQTNCSGLSARLGSLRAHGLWADCEVAVGGAGVRVRAHRVLLASASPVLASMLYGPTATRDLDHVIVLPDIDPDVFDVVLEYIYTDNMIISSLENACSLYRAAHFFVLPHLQATCKYYLLGNVSSGSVLHVYEFAQMFGENEIIEKCLEVMSKETQEVLEGPGFEKARPDTLEKPFSLSSLNLSSELELFKAAERWVQSRTPTAAHNQENIAQVIGNAEDDNNNNTTDPKILIRNALKEIRFLTLHQEEFAGYDMTTLLSESELLALSLRLITEKTYMKLPEGFSDSSEKRCQKTYRIKVNVKDLRKDELNINIQPTCVPKFTWKLNLKKFNIRNKMSLNIEAQPSELERLFDPWICHATVKVKILSHKEESQYNWKVTHYFCSDRTRKNLFPPHFISLEDILNPENGYLQEDTVTFEVKIVARSTSRIRVLGVNKS